MNIFKKKNKLIYIFLVAIFASVTTTPSISKAYSVEEVELKRDLIEELKSKYNLDPENKPKDQCDLMFKITEYLIVHGCENYNICYNVISFYNYDKDNKYISMDIYNQVILYQKSSYKIFGIYGYRTLGFDEEYYLYDDYKKSRDNFEKQSYVYSNINAPNSSKTIKLSVSNNFNYNPRASYLKIRGCYVEDFHITNEDKKHFINQK